MLIEERKPMRENPSLSLRVNLSAEINRQIKEFERSGGRIEVVPIGKSGEFEATSSIRISMAEKRIKVAKAKEADKKASGLVVNPPKASRDPYSMYRDEVQFQKELEEFKSNREKYKYITPKTVGVGFRFEFGRGGKRYNKSSKTLEQIVKYRDDFLRNFNA